MLFLCVPLAKEPGRLGNLTPYIASFCCSEIWSWGVLALTEWSPGALSKDRRCRRLNAIIVKIWWCIICVPIHNHPVECYRITIMSASCENKQVINIYCLLILVDRFWCSLHYHGVWTDWVLFGRCNINMAARGSFPQTFIPMVLAAKAFHHGTSPVFRTWTDNMLNQIYWPCVYTSLGPLLR